MSYYSDVVIKHAKNITNQDQYSSAPSNVVPSGQNSLP